MQPILVGDFLPSREMNGVNNEKSEMENFWVFAKNEYYTQHNSEGKS